VDPNMRPVCAEGTLIAEDAKATGVQAQGARATGFSAAVTSPLLAKLLASQGLMRPPTQTSQRDDVNEEVASPLEESSPNV